jgi:hypothetical protein
MGVVVKNSSRRIQFRRIVSKLSSNRAARRASEDATSKPGEEER